MNAAAIWLVIKTLLTIAPVIISMVRDGQIKEGAYDEVIGALTDRLNKRFDAAKEAGEKEPVDEENDPNNRAR